MRLHIGGQQRRPGWTVIDVIERPGVTDIVGNCLDLSRFADNSVTEIYASHVYEHLAHADELLPAIQEAYRVLRPKGLFRVGVPDLEVLCRLMLDPRLSFDERLRVMRIMYGGQIDRTDFHKVGLTFELFKRVLEHAGFTSVRRVGSFGLFDDATNLTFRGVPISLNITALKP